jgi:phosphate transport system substrate-binding protein
MAVVGVLMLVGIHQGFATTAAPALIKGSFTLNPEATRAGCSPPPTVGLTGAGSTLVYPLMSQWATVYAGGTSVSYLSVGSGAGIADITAKTADFGATDAPLNPAERAAAPGLLTVPESAGGVVPIYNVPGVPILNFTGAVLAGVYLGTITNWNNSALQAINPGVTLPNATIQVVYRSDGSGTTFIWTSYLSADNTTWSSTVGKGISVAFPTGTGEPKESGMASYVQATPYTIGYADLSIALTDVLSFGAVQNPAGHFILATVNNTASALHDANPTLPSGDGDWYNVSVLNAPGTYDYPITSLTYVLVYQDLSAAYSTYNLTKAENLATFLWWIVTTGQSYSAQLYFVPLPQSIVLHDEATIETMTFNGSPVPVCGSSTTSQKYAVTFVESGLGSGANWSVTLGGVTNSSTTDRVSFQLPNGSVTWTVSAVRGYASNQSTGSVDVQGAPRTFFVGFTAVPVLYSLTFTESGLPVGTDWSVTVGGATHTSANTSIAFQEVNGSYSYQVGAVAGYTVSPSGGPLTVAGAPVQEDLGFTSTGGSSHVASNGLSLLDYAVLALVVAVLAILAILVLVRRKRDA